MIYLQPITFYAILRHLPDGHQTEIAEHPDGAMKAYAAEWQANEALMEMNGPNDQLRSGPGWHIDEILMVPPPMTAEAERRGMHKEIDAAIAEIDAPIAGVAQQKRSSRK
jgi:hypothetical protein